MRSLWASLRSIGPARANAAVALALLVETAIEFALLPQRPHFGVAVACGLAAIAGFALRLRAPLPALALGLAALLGFSWLGSAYTDHLVSGYFIVLFLVYSAGRRLEDRLAIVAGVLAAVAQTVGLLIDDYKDSPTNYVTSIVFVAAAPLLIGRFMRHRARLHDTLVDKARRLERERDARAEAAALHERTRIAGELHDVVAHALSAMVVQAGAARRLAERDPERAGTAFRAVEDTGREALTEIRSLLGVLRREDEELGLAPQPSLRHVRSLVGRVRTAGLPVELSVEGEERELPAGIDLTAYRVVQEALRAALEAGRAGHADVRLRYAADHLLLEVGDDGSGLGRSLPGVPERVALYGGSLRAAARRDGGHLVRARLPVVAP